MRKLRTGNFHFLQKAAVRISPAFWKEARTSSKLVHTLPQSFHASLHSKCLETADSVAALWSSAALSHPYPQLYGERDTVSWTTFYLFQKIHTHAWASHKIHVINWKSPQVNKGKIKREVQGSHIQLFALEILNEYSLRANYKMLTLKCWVAGRIMGYCTVKMPDSCMLSCCVI